MERTESRQYSNPESTNIILITPEKLMHDNPAALIVNKESYDRMKAHFSPDQFDLPQIVKVTITASQHQEVTRDFVVDGMTRTKFIVDYEEVIVQQEPTFKFKVRDVTSALLQNPAVVPPQEKQEGQTSLTMLQYLRAVVPPTVEHSRIAPDRIAAHLINGWDNMVGETIADKFSAVAALNFLAREDLFVATDEGLKKDLAQQPLLAEEGEESDIQGRLCDGLVKMNQIIRQTRLVRPQIVQAAFFLVGTGSSVIGGERESLRQAYGLLRIPEIDSKLRTAVTHKGEREQVRHELGLKAYQAYKKAAEARNRTEIVNCLNQASKDPLITLDHLSEIFLSENPIARYRQTLIEINKQRLTNNYNSTYKAERDTYRAVPLTELEAQLLDALGNRMILEVKEIHSFNQLINTADITDRGAKNLKDKLQTTGQELSESGVSENFIDESIRELQLAQTSLMNSNSPALLRKNTKDLETATAGIRRKIEAQTTQYQIGQIVEAVTGGKLSEGYGPSVKTDIIKLVFSQFRFLDHRTNLLARQWIEQLSSLDHDLFLKVRDGELGLPAAIQTQKERELQKQTTVVEEVKQEATPTPEEQPAETPDTTPTAARRRSTSRQQEQPPSEAEAQPEETKTKPTTETKKSTTPKDEEIEIKHKRERLTAGLTTINGVLTSLSDFIPQDITEVQREGIMNIIKRLGYLAYNHPDLPNLIVEALAKIQADNQSKR